MAHLKTLSKYYEYIEPIALDISEDVVAWHKKHGDPSVEARYLVETAYRIAKSPLYNMDREIININTKAIQSALTYLDLLRDYLDEFLSGEMKGSEIVKMGGKKLWEEFNLDNPLMDIFSTSVANKVAPIVEDKDVLELGGGVGGTTTKLSENLKQASSFYFTDIKTYFLKSIEKQLQDLNITTELLDLKNPPDDFALFDVIYATNVIHVVSDIESSLKWIKDHLKENGILILGEGSPYSKTCPWPLELMFSMFEGWHNILRFEQRPYPGWLLPEQWLNFFSKAGFRQLNVEIMMDEKRLFGGTYFARKDAH